MGWSGYCVNLDVTVSVDAHAGEREERGERLYEELVTRLRAACKGVLDDPKWEQNEDAIRIFTHFD
jgi:hypothetical protein